MEIKQKIGNVTEEEKTQVQQLFERRNGLQELAKIVNANDEELYEKLVKDMGTTETKFQQWWNDMSKKYQWPSADGGHWEIDFNNNTIYLAKDGKKCLQANC